MRWGVIGMVCVCVGGGREREGVYEAYDGHQAGYNILGEEFSLLCRTILLKDQLPDSQHPAQLRRNT